MRIFVALVAAVFTSAGSAAEPPQASSQEQQPRQVELKWQAVKAANNEGNMKQRTVAKLQNRQRVAPKPEPLRRVQNEQGEWVIGHPVAKAVELPR